jgi:hypothetical protein
MRRPLLVGALAAAVITLIASAAVAVGALGGPPSGATMMRGNGQSRGSGMMGQGQSSGSGITGGSMMGSSMMGSASGMGMSWLPGNGVAVSAIPAAKARAATAAAAAGLHPGEVMWFDNGFYVELKDAAGNPATEVIVDPRTGAVTTEPGPAMMWNTRTGMHARIQGARPVAGAVDTRKARTIATGWLATNQAGTTIGSIDAYPGYFTLDLRRNGVVSGMMSVSSTNGAVWYHTWHGTFIAMEDS